MGAIKNPRFLLPILSHSAGIISATFSNGVVLSRTIATDVTLLANTLYMVYLVPGGTLRISANANSVGPAGFSTWILVGAFYSNAAASIAWGSFVNIEGPPETQNEIQEANSATLIALFGGFTGFTLSAYTWSRVGRHLFVTWRTDNNSSTGVSARIPLPRGGITGIENNGVIGTYAGQNAAVNASGGSMIGLASTDVGFAGPNLNGAAVSVQTGTAVVGTGPTTLTGSFRTHIAQWSATPLKDL